MLLFSRAMTHGMSKKFQLVLEIRAQHPGSDTDAQPCQQVAIFIELHSDVVLSNLLEPLGDRAALRSRKRKSAGDFDLESRLLGDRA